jgi:hypothetical protein
MEVGFAMKKRIAACVMTGAAAVAAVGVGMPTDIFGISSGSSSFNITASAKIKGDYCYDVQADGTASIYGYIGNETNAVIPEEIDGHTVTKIDSAAFHEVTSVETVTVPSTVTSIGSTAFVDCTNLKSVTIPESVTEIGERAFYGCVSLESVNLPSKLDKISDGLFCDCSSLKSVSLPDKITSIGVNAFYGCSSLEEITIPYGVTSVGNGAFMECTSLKSVFVPEDVTEIGNHAFGWYTDKTYNFYLTLSDFELVCTSGSAAQNYAKENKLTCKIHTHSYKSTVTKKATCTAKGVKTYTCSCGKKYTSAIAKTSHKYTVKKVVKPTLSAQGYTLKTCSVCKKTAKTNYTAKLISAKKFTVSGVRSAYVYKGKAIKPAVTVKYGKTTLKNGTDYTVKYTSNVKTGKAKITITGKGKYGGTTAKYFKIVPVKQTITGIRSPKTTAIKVAWKKDSQASGYEIRFSTSSSFKSCRSVSVSKKYTARTLKGLKKGKTYYVKVRSYKLIDGKRAYGKFSAVKKVKCK